MDEEGSRTLVWKKPRLGVEEWVLSGKSPVSTLPTLSQTPFCPGKSPGIHIVPELQNKENSCLSLSNLTPESSLGPPGPRSVLLKFCLVRGLDSEGDLGPPPRVGSVTPGFLNRGETRVVTGRLSAGTKEPIFYSVCLDEDPGTPNFLRCEGPLPVRATWERLGRLLSKENVINGSRDTTGSRNPPGFHKLKTVF